MTDVQGHVFRERCKEKVKECILSKPEVVICSELSKVLDTSTVLPKDIHLANVMLFTQLEIDFHGKRILFLRKRVTFHARGCYRLHLHVYDYVQIFQIYRWKGLI